MSNEPRAQVAAGYWPYVPVKACSVCGKYFERRDALRRHAAIHDVNRPPPKRHRKACIACVQSKTRCDSQRPSCSKCRKRASSCHYASDTVMTNAQSTYTNVNIGSPDSVPPNSHLDTMPGIDTMQVPAATHILPNALDELNFYGPYFDGDYKTDFDWIFPDCIGDSLSLINDNTILPQSVEAGQQHQQLHTPSSIQSDTGSSSKSLVQDHEIGANRKEPGDKSIHLDDQWPMEWSAAPPKLQDLPPLGSSHDLAYYPLHFTIPGLNIANVQVLQDLLRLPSDNSLWSQVLLNAFPTGRKLDHCIDLFFTHFSKNFPIVHRTTFDPAKEPVLTLAIITIGACYTGLDGSRAFANSLSELTRRILIYMAEHDPRFVRTEYFVTAQLFQSIHGFSSGDKHLYEIAEKTRSTLIHNARCMGLFEPKPINVESDSSLENRWQWWIQAEKSRRLAWAVYIFDVSAIYTRGDRPYMSIFEMLRLELPTSAEHWEAESAQAWAALHPWTDILPQSNSFEKNVENLLQDPASTLAKNTNEHSRHILLNTIFRMISTNEEAIHEPGARFFAGYDLLIHKRRTLLDLISLFSSVPYETGPLRTPYNEEALIHGLYIIHFSRLCLPGEVAGHYNLVWRGSERQESARRHIHSWVVDNPIQARQLMFAGAQALALARRYPYNHPHEPYNVFHMGLFLWLTALLYSDSPWYSEATKPGSEGACQLDELEKSNHGQPSADLQRWIDTGKPQIVRISGVPNIFSTLGQREMLEEIASILKRMCVWGIAQNFLNAIRRIKETMQFR